MILALVACLLSPGDSVTDRAQLLAGVTTVEPVGLPGPVAVFGPHAFAVLTAKQGEAVVAAARFGEGRVVAFGHNGFLGRADQDSGRGRLLANALRWVGGEDVRVADVREVSSFEGVEVVTWGGGDLAEETQADLRRFVEGGGGLVVGQCPWGWQQLNPGLSLREEAPVNRVVAPMGLAFAPTTLGGPYSVEESRPEEAHALRALEVLEETGKVEAFGVLERALQSVPAHDALFLPVVQDLLARKAGFQAPTPTKPVTKEATLDRLHVANWTRRWEDASTEEIRAAPGADAFPGAVPSAAARGVRTLRFEERASGWLSTGLYAPAGEQLSLRLLEGESAGWSLRIGPHTDSIAALDAWLRWPAISRRFELDRDSVASPFGGLIYLEPGPRAKWPLEFEIAGVVDAPFFDLSQGEESHGWADPDRFPAPWAEIAGHHLIVTVPSKAIRSVGDPAGIAKFWDAVMQAHYRLGQRVLPAAPERFVADVQISAGYMHSGYPIMTHLDVTEPSAGHELGLVVDVERLRNEGSWGHFHEIGHNCQRSWWTFAGTGEVTCNWFALHAMEQVVGIDPWEVEWLQNAKRGAPSYLRKGASFDVWKRKPGVALLMYAQLQREFGWDPYYRVLAEYEGLPRGELPGSEADRRDEWFLRMSRAVDRDLGPFFERWGVPVSDVAQAQVAELEDWMPDFRELGLERADGSR